MTPEELSATHKAAFAPARGWSAQEFATFLADVNCFAAGDARAFALVRVTLDEAELLTIATAPDHQGQGLAGKVMADWLTTARNRGATRAFLEVAEDNRAALALYARSGFAPCGRRRGYYSRAGAPAVDAIVMARSLP